MTIFADLTDYVTLQEPTSTTDALGGQTVTWSDVDVVGAQVREISAREALQAAALQATLSHRVILRYRSDLRPTWRVVKADGTILEVVGSRELEGRRRWLELDCVSRVSSR